MISSGFSLKSTRQLTLLDALFSKGLRSDLYLCVELTFKRTEMVFDLSEPLVFKFFRRCNHQGAQGCRAHTLHLAVNFVFYFFWDDVFSHNLQQEEESPDPVKGAPDMAWETQLVFGDKGCLQAELLPQLGDQPCSSDRLKRCLIRGSDLRTAGKTSSMFVVPPVPVPIPA